MREGLEGLGEQQSEGRSEVRVCVDGEHKHIVRAHYMG